MIIYVLYIIAIYHRHKQQKTKNTAHFFNSLQSPGRRQHTQESNNISLSNHNLYLSLKLNKDCEANEDYEIDSYHSL